MIAIGGILAIANFFIAQLRNNPGSNTQPGRVILLGLEVLHAADIITTVVTEPTQQKVLPWPLLF